MGDLVTGDGWIRSAERVVIVQGGIARLGQTFTTDPRKILWHTIEGTIAGALAVYRTILANPQITYSPSSRRLLQHCPLTAAGYALLRGPGAVSMNRRGPIQVELEGHAAEVPSWPDEWLANIAEDVVAPIVEFWPQINPDLVAGFVNYPQSYGVNAAQRMTEATFATFAGQLGHQHATYNDHGNPGGLNAARIATHYRTLTDNQQGEEIDMADWLLWQGNSQFSPDGGATWVAVPNQWDSHDGEFTNYPIRAKLAALHTQTNPDGTTGPLRSGNADAGLMAWFKEVGTYVASNHTYAPGVAPVAGRNYAYNQTDLLRTAADRTAAIQALLAAGISVKVDTDITVEDLQPVLDAVAALPPQVVTEFKQRL